MDRLDVMKLFLRVADAGSFSRAAQEAGVSQPTASKQIAALEARLGVQLLQRTTRGLALTTAGQDFYDSTVQLLDTLEAAESRVGKGHVSPAGLVRVAASPAFGRMYIVPHLPEFFARYPEVEVDFSIADRHVNLVEDGIDVAIRLGHLADSNLTARRIGSMRVLTMATPAYLAEHGTPRHVEDLRQHQCVVFNFDGKPWPWIFRGSDGSFSFEPAGKFSANDAEHIRAAVLAGLGLAHTASWAFAAELATGTVTEVLGSFAPPLYPIHLIFPSRRHIPGRVRVFADFLAGLFAREPHLATP